METVIIISAFVAVVAGSPWLVEKFNDFENWQEQREQVALMEEMDQMIKDRGNTIIVPPNPNRQRLVITLDPIIIKPTKGVESID